MAAELSRALSEPVRHYAIPVGDYAKLGFPGAENLANMFQFKSDFEAEYTASRPIVETRELYPELQSFRQWLERNVQKLPVPAAA